MLLFREDKQEEHGVWVDRGIDDRVDAFGVCAPCHDALKANDPRGERWHEEEELCPQCRSDFAAHALQTDWQGLPRPVNGMLENRVLINDDCGTGVPSPAPCMGDEYSPGGCGPTFQRAYGGFEPSAGDAFSPNAYDRFLPGQGDPFPPGPGDYLGRGMNDYSPPY